MKKSLQPPKIIKMRISNSELTKIFKVFVTTIMKIEIKDSNLVSIKMDCKIITKVKFIFTGFFNGMASFQTIGISSFILKRAYDKLKEDLQPFFKIEKKKLVVDINSLISRYSKMQIALVLIYGLDTIRVSLLDLLTLLTLFSRQYSIVDLSNLQT